MKRFYCPFIYAFLLSAFLLIFNACSTSPEISDNQITVDKARRECIELNREFNQLYQVIMLNYAIKGDPDFESAAICLQKLMPKIMSVNKSLQIDCINYDEDGEPIMVKHEDGNLYPGESLPNELKIEK